jgi:PKD repeat protein
VSFTQSLNSHCGVPVQVSFSNSSNLTNLNWNFGNGQVGVGNNPATNYQNIGNYLIKLVGQNNFGCKDSTTAQFSALQNPTASFSGSDTACLISNVHFINLSQNANQFQWTFGDGNTSTQVEPNNLFNTPGIFNVSLVAQNGSCTDTFTLAGAVQVFPKPIADFTSSTADSGRVSFTQTSQGAVSWQWIFGGGDTSSVQNPVYTFINFGDNSVQLTVTDANGCVDSVSHSVKIELFKNIVVPNALIIGGSGETSLFLPKGTGLKTYNCGIYDKWGNQIWFSEKLIDGRPGEGWNGFYKDKEVQEGAYIWKIEATFADGTVWNGLLKDSKTNQTGTVTVLR